MKKKKKKNQTAFYWPYLTFRNVSLGLISITFLIYTNTLGHQYVLDDAILITENSLTKTGISGIFEIFKHDTFYGFFNTDGKANLVSGGRYRPLSQILFAIEYSAFGLNPFWGHLINVLYYCFCSFSVLFVLNFLIRNTFKKKEALLIASIGALLFALHPIHTEVVANIKGRDEILALSLCLWSTYMSMLGASNKNYKKLFFGAVLFFMALLAKEVSIGFIVVTPLAFFLFRSTNLRSVTLVTSPIIAGFIFYLILRFSVLGFNFGGNPPLELMNNPFLNFEGGQYVGMTTWEKVPQIIFGLGKYIQLSIFPHPLTHDYYPRHLQVSSITDWKVLSSLCAMIFLSIWGIRNYGNNKLVFFSIVFFFATLFITSNIVFPVGTHLSERFLFTPSLGACLLVAYLLVQFYKSGKSKWAPILFIIILFGFVYKTIDRNRIWQDNFTLFTTDVQTSVSSAKARNAAGGALIERSRTLSDSSQSQLMLMQAISHLEMATNLHPHYKNAYLLLGNAHFYLGKFDASIAAYDRALQLDPNYKNAKQNRALAQRDFARFRGEKLKDLSGAIELLEKAALELKEDYETHRLLGVAYGNLGDATKAVSNFLIAVAQKKDDASTLFNLGMAYLAKGDSLNANHYISQAKQINPDIGRR